VSLILYFLGSFERMGWVTTPVLPKKRPTTPIAKPT
jgi:hypothetical protein